MNHSDGCIEYRCAMCKVEFPDLASATNHIKIAQEAVTKSSKCSNCLRANFSTICSLLKHEEQCNLNFRFNQNPVVKLEKMKPPPYLFKDLEKFKDETSPKHNKIWRSLSILWALMLISLILFAVTQLNKHTEFLMTGYLNYLDVNDAIITYKNCGFKENFD